MRRFGMALTIFVLLILSTAADLPRAAASTNDSPIKKLWIEPAPMGLWLVLELDQEKGAAASTLRLGFRFEKDEWHWTDRVGKPKSLATANNYLYVVFDDGPIWRYSLEDGQFSDYLVLRLPAPYELENLATDVNRRQLYGLGKVNPLGEETVLTTAAAAQTAPAVPPAGSLGVFQYDGGQWSAVGEFPQVPESASEAKLTAYPGGVDVVVRTGPRTFRRWSFAENRWRSAKAFELDSAADRYWLSGQPNGDLIMVTSQSEQGSHKFQLYNIDSNDTVRKIASLQRPELAALSTNVLDVGFAADEVLVAWLTERTTVKLARFDLAGAPVGEVQDLPSTLGQRQQQMDTLTLIALAFLILLTFFSRAFRGGTVPTLPKTLALADYWRRLLAATIDFVPVSILTSVIWYDYFERISRSASFSELLQSQAADKQILWIKLFAFVAFAAYCTIAELIWSATPGKMVFGLHVRVARSPQFKPTPVQIIIRNAFKILELYLPPLLFVIFFFQLRQRIGDMFAGTIVVQPSRQPGEPTDDD